MAAKKATKKDKRLILIVAVVLVIVLAMGYLYFTNAEAFDAIVALFLGEDTDGGKTPPAAWGGGLTAADGDLVVSYIDVGTGDCILLQFPDGKNMLIDGGENENEVADTIVEYLEARNVTTLDYVLLTHSDSDHVGSLDSAVEAVDSVGKVYMPKLISREPDLGITDCGTITTLVYDSFENAIVEKIPSSRRATDIIYTEGILVIDGGTYRMTMYCSDAGYYSYTGNWDAKRKNDASPICILEYAGRRLVFTGDANNRDYSSFSQEQNFLDDRQAESITNIDCDVLKVGHHGSDGSSCTEFLNFLDCEYAVISVGTPTSADEADDGELPYNAFVSSAYADSGKYAESYVNNHGHPTEDVAGAMGRLQATGTEYVYRTDFFGTIVLTVAEDGSLSWLTENTPNAEGATITFVAETSAATISTVTIVFYYESEEKREDE